MRDCQWKPVRDLGSKDLELRGPSGVNFVRVTVAPVAKNLLSVSALVKAGHEVLCKKEGSFVRHKVSGKTQRMREVNGVYELDFDLKPFAQRVAEMPPRHDE